MGLICFPVVSTPEILGKKNHNTILHFQGPQQIAPSVLTSRWMDYCINGTVTEASNILDFGRCKVINQENTDPSLTGMNVKRFIHLFRVKYTQTEMCLIPLLQILSFNCLNLISLTYKDIFK